MVGTKSSRGLEREPRLGQHLDHVERDRRSGGEARRLDADHVDEAADAGGPIAKSSLSATARTPANSAMQSAALMPGARRFAPGEHLLGAPRPWW
jgi:hypothetical protein